jgi:hypothetical protein
VPQARGGLLTVNDFQYGIKIFNTAIKIFDKAINCRQLNGVEFSHQLSAAHFVRQKRSRLRLAVKLRYALPNNMFARMHDNMLRTSE